MVLRFKKADLRSLAVLSVVLLSASLFMASAQVLDTESIPPKVIIQGHTLTALGGATFSDASLGLINYSKYSHSENELIDFNISSKIFLPKLITLSTDANVQFVERLNLTPFNMTVGTVEDGNVTVVQVNSSWTRIDVSSFDNGSITTRGFTLNFSVAESKVFRAKLYRAYNEQTVYSWFINTSILGTMVVLDFDPEFDAIKFGMTGFETPTPYRVWQSANAEDKYGWQAFDGDITQASTDVWEAGAPGVTTGWLIMDFGADNATIVNEYRLLMSDATRAVKDFHLLGSNDNITFTLLNSSLGITGWTNGVNKTFPFSNTQAYRYYRFNVTAITGTILQVAEIYFNKTTAASDAFPLLLQNSTNSSSPKKGDVARYDFNLSDDVGLSFFFAGHNMTANGAEANITVPLYGATTANFSVNITMILSASNFYVKPYINDSINQKNNTIPPAFYTTLASLPTVSVAISNSTSPNSTASLSSEQLFSNVNFSDVDLHQEANSTFKWFKRTLPQPQNRSLVGFWKLDGNANDSSAYGNGGTVFGAVSNQSMNCRIDDCLTFDGINDFVNLSNAVYFGTSFTMEAWINPQLSLSKSTVIDFNDNTNLCYLRVNDTAVNTASFACSGSLAAVDTASVIGGWHHVVGVRDGSTAYLYVDGVLKATDSSFTTNTFTSTNSIIGLEPWQGVNYFPFNGSIDEVAVYSYAKSAAEILNDYKNSPYSAMIYKDAVAYWHLDENGGTNGYADSSGNGNTLIQNGTPANTSGIIKGALTFDSNNDLANASDVGSLTVTGNITLAMWLKLVGHPNNFNTVIQKGDGTAANNAYYMAVRGTAQLEFQLRQDVSNQNTLDLARILDNDTWYHVAATNNGTHLIFYLNGAEANKTAQTITSISNIITAFTIGGRFVAGRFNGSVDEVAIYNRSLSPSEIKQLYLRTWYDVSPQLFLLHPDNNLNASNLSDFNTTDMERPTAISGAVLQPGRYVENLSADNTAPNGNVTGYWRFDAGGSTTTANDSSNFGNDGTLTNGVIWVNDSVGGKALKFDGVNDYVSVNNAANLQITGDITLEAWIKPTGVGVDFQAIVEKGSVNSAYGFEWRNTTGKIRMKVNSGTIATVTSSEHVANNTWTHVVGTYNGTHIAVYLNGIISDSVSDTGSINTETGKLGIGSNAVAPANYPFNGTIDEVRILNRSLSAAEVLSDYRKAATGMGLLSNDYINYSATGNFNEKEGTVEFWIKPEWNGNDGLNHVFLNTHLPANSDFQIYKDLANDVRVYFGNPGIYAMRYLVTSWPSGNWHHVGVTWNNYTSNSTLHIDGIQVNNSGDAFSISSVSRLVLGLRDGTTQFCNCTLSEFRISRKALTAQEINFSFSKSRSFFQNEYMLNGSNYVKDNALILEYLPSDSSSTVGSRTNSSVVFIQNVVPPIPVIGTPTANSYNATSTITWAAVTDADGDAITYRIYVNGTFNASTTLTSLTLDMTSERNYAVNLSAFDGTEDSGNGTQVQFVFDNVNPSVSSTSFSTTGGIVSSPLLFGQNMDWIAATATDTYLNHVNITLRNPNGIAVENVLMTNQGSNVWNYTTDVSLNVAGNWTINISAYDNASNRGFQLLNFTVNTQNLSTREGLYGYSDDSIFTAADITGLSSYGFDVLEISANFSTLPSDWNSILLAINNTKAGSSLIGLNFKVDFNVSNANLTGRTADNITAYFPTLKNDPYSITVGYISFEIVNETTYNSTDKTATLNNLSLTAANAFSNQFVVYSKNFNSSNLTSSYIKYTPLIYVLAGSQNELITLERDLLRQNKSLNRIYTNLTTALKSQSYNYQKDVLKQLRGIPANNANISNISVAEIDTSVNDVVVFNVNSTAEMLYVNVSNVSGIAGKDAWDATQKKLLANNTNGAFSVNVSAYSANLIFFEDVDHLQLDSLTTGVVYKQDAPSILSLNYTDATRDDNYALYGANDFRIELYDPHYVGNNFLTYYGWINASTINLSNKLPYAAGIIADKLDKEVDKLNYSSTTWYGYISVADYANTNAWVTSKNGEVDAWHALNGSLQIFIDGLDSGIGGANFSSRFRDVVDYAKITKDKNVILNTYTAYENFSTWGDGVMKESCVQRWNGADASNPDSYSREVWSLEVNRSKFFKNHNIPVYCQAFGNRTASNFNQIENYTDTLNIYYASKVLGYQYFYLSQPDFNYVHTVYVPELGTDLSKDVITDDNVTYYRRYSNGIVYYNTSSQQGRFDDGRTVFNTRLCFDLWDNHANGVTFSFTVNREVAGSDPGDYNISDSELGGQSVWTTVCRNLNATEQNKGRWDIQGFVLPRTTIIGQGMNIGNAIVGYENRHSWYDSSTPNSWTLYGMGQNWQVNLEINDTKKASIDSVNTISQSEANATVNGKTLQNITLTSGFAVNSEVWSYPTFTNNSRFLNLSYWTGTAWELLYPANNSDCDSANPTLNTTTVNGNPYKSCIEPSGNGYNVRVAPYKLSDQTFQATFQGNTAPPTPTIPFPSAGQATPLNRINYSATDADGDSITYYVSFNGSFNYSANINTTFNATPEKTYAFNVSAFDGTDFSSNTSTVQFVYDPWSPRLTNGSGSDNVSGYVNRNYVDINYTVAEQFNDTYLIRNGSGGVVSNSTVTANASYFARRFTGLNDGVYTFSGWANDTAGNANLTGNVTLTVDTTFPFVGFGVGSDSGNVSRGTLLFNITINETNVDNLTLFLKNSTHIVSFVNVASANASPGFNNVTLTGIANGFYNASAYARDLAGNVNFSANRSVVVDTSIPGVTIYLPSANSSVSAASDGSGIALNFSAADNVTAVSACWYGITDSSGAVNVQNTTLPGCANTTVSVTKQDTFRLTLYANDSAGNANQSFVVFTVTVPASDPTQKTSGSSGSGGGPPGLNQDALCGEIRYFIMTHLSSNLTPSYNSSEVEGLLVKVNNDVGPVSLGSLEAYLGSFQAVCGFNITQPQQSQLLPNAILPFANVTKELIKFIVREENDSLTVPGTSFDIPIFGYVDLGLPSWNIGNVPRGLAAFLNYFVKLSYSTALCPDLKSDGLPFPAGQCPHPEVEWDGILNFRLWLWMIAATGLGLLAFKRWRKLSAAAAKA